MELMRRSQCCIVEKVMAGRLSPSSGAHANPRSLRDGDGARDGDLGRDRDRWLVPGSNTITITSTITIAEREGGCKDWPGCALCREMLASPVQSRPRMAHPDNELVAR